ncbi:hypothetical protein B0T21DRAFT_284217, partial [Apiosordaria backusii]
LIDAPNKVPHQQRVYQAAYRAHTRIWRISPRSNIMLTPYFALMWGTFGACMYGMGRQVCGYKTWFGKN